MQRRFTLKTCDFEIKDIGATFRECGRSISETFFRMILRSTLWQPSTGMQITSI
jgi:hypothetical protein